MLTIKNVHKQFGSKKIIDDLSLQVKKGSIAMLLGSSGVGKSTLLRILSGLEKPDAGIIDFDGTLLEIATLQKKHMAGMVFQQFNLFDHLTVERNITLPLELVLKKSHPEAKTIALELLERYGLADKKDKYPSQLSGGQKQRLALARALALKPKILCLDEPTSALDPLLTAHVANSIKQLADEGYVILVASHDTSLLEKLPCTIYLMRDGKIIETADAQTFYKNQEAYPAIKKFVQGTIE